MSRRKWKIAELEEFIFSCTQGRWGKYALCVCVCLCHRWRKCWRVCLPRRQSCHEVRWRLVLPFTSSVYWLLIICSKLSAFCLNGRCRGPS